MAVFFGWELICGCDPEWHSQPLKRAALLDSYYFNKNKHEILLHSTAKLDFLMSAGFLVKILPAAQSCPNERNEQPTQQDAHQST